MKRILLFIDWYLPGYKAGGPIRTIANMVDALGDKYEFLIVTRDCDHGSSVPYEGILRGTWQSVGKAKVRYLAPNERKPRTFLQIINETDFDLIYCQSFWSRPFTMLPLLVHRFSKKRRIPALIAPRGEFSSGSLGKKPLRKKVFFATMRRVLRFFDLAFHCSTAAEINDVRKVFGDRFRCFCALNFPAQVGGETPAKRAENPGGALRVCSLGRISPEKNVRFAISCFKRVTSAVIFDIFGGYVDADYFAECQAAAEELPPNVKVNFRGELPHEKISAALASYELFFFPSRGENFGHVVHEALLASLPCLLSDRTPWKELDSRGAGWELPLGDSNDFAQKIDDFAGFSAEMRAAMNSAARKYGEDVSHDPAIRADNIAMFEELMN